jgi:hypothetical protein
MRTILTIILTIFFSSTAFGTIQKSDEIVYNGKKYDLPHIYPMENYFKKYPEKYPQSEHISTNLWRGYLATFKIKDDQLYLTNIEIIAGDTIDKKGYSKTIWKSVLNEIFPKQKSVKSDWMTGLLLLTDSRFYSKNDYYILLEINEGNITKKKRFNSDEEYYKFREKQFQAFKKTDEYNNVKAELQKDGRSDENVDSFLRNLVIKYTSKILVE